MHIFYALELFCYIALLWQLVFVLVWLDHKVPKDVAESHSWVCPSVFTGKLTFVLVSQKNRFLSTIKVGTLHYTEGQTGTNSDGGAVKTFLP